MIQRIQSVFLLIASLCLGGLYLLPLGGSKLPVEKTAFSDSIFNINDYSLLQIVVPIGVVVFLASIFLFNNRKVQSMTTLIGAVIIGIIIGFVGMQIFQSQEILTGENTFLWKPGIALPIVSLISALLASRAIKKDDNLVKSMDRLR